MSNTEPTPTTEQTVIGTQEASEVDADVATDKTQVATDATQDLKTAEAQGTTVAEDAATGDESKAVADAEVAVHADIKTVEGQAVQEGDIIVSQAEHLGGEEEGRIKGYIGAVTTAAKADLQKLLHLSAGHAGTLGAYEASEVGQKFIVDKGGEPHTQEGKEAAEAANKPEEPQATEPTTPPVAPTQPAQPAQPESAPAATPEPPAEAKPTTGV